MWKNIGKAGIWFAIYFGLQNIFSTILAIGAVLSDISAIPDVASDAFMDYVLDVVMSTAVPALAISGAVMLLIYILHRRYIKQPLYLKTIEWQKVILFLGVGFLLNLVTSLGVTLISEMLPESWNDSLSQSIDLVSTGQNFWLLLLTTGILVPIMEEITFRYGIHQYIARSNVTWAIILSSVVFGLMHGNPIQIAYATVMGVILALVYQKTQNLWYPIIIHMAVNSSSICSILFESDAAFVGALTGAGLVLLIAGIFACKKIPASKIAE